LKRYLIVNGLIGKRDKKKTRAFQRREGRMSRDFYRGVTFYNYYSYYTLKNYKIKANFNTS
jgi:hypothetical protein